MLNTPLESRPSPWYTTRSEEATFLSALAADSPRVSVQQIGAGAIDNTPIHLVTVSAPTAKPSGDAESILVIAFQHGEEPATREAAIALVRDLAYTSEASVVSYLSAHPVHVIVSANPDRIGEQVRNNKNNIDLNRDHLALSQPETRAIEQAIKSIRPAIILDWHENNDTGVTLQFGSPSQVQADSGVRNTSNSLRTAIENHVKAQGYTVGPYSAGNTPQILRNTGSLRHSPTILFETDRTSFNMTTRIQQTLTAFRGALNYHSGNANTVKDTVVSARAAKTAEGLSATVPFNLGSETLSPPPTGYLITEAQRFTASAHLDIFGISVTPQGSNWIIPLSQSAQPIIPFLFDASSEWRIVAAERISQPVKPLIGSPSTWGPIQIAGGSYPVRSVGVYDGEVVQPVWTAA